MKPPSPEIIAALAGRLVDIGVGAERIPSDALAEITTGRVMLIVVHGDKPCPCCNKKPVWAATLRKTKIPLEKLFR